MQLPFVNLLPSETARYSLSFRRLGAIGYDALAISSAWLAALMFRFSFETGLHPPPVALHSMYWVVPICMAIFVAFGLYRGIWYFASVPDLLRISRAVAIATVCILIVATLADLVGPVPRSVFILFPVFLFLLTAGARLVYRAAKERLTRGIDNAVNSKKAIVIGAGSSGAMLLKELGRNCAWQVVGLLDDDEGKVGKEVMGHRVLGPISAVGHWSKLLEVRDVIVAIPSVRPERRAQILKQCVDAGLHVRSMPSMQELLAGTAKPSSLRDIGLEDLIGRPAVKINSAAVSSVLHDKTVMVTGAGGSIGSELCKQIARFKPRKLILLELSEYALYKIDQNLRETTAGIEIIALTADVKDAAALRSILSQYQPSVVFHAAAYKHVPLMEERNCWQAIRNNTFGTYQITKACLDQGVDAFILISTDKAVNPANVMGASKRLAEMICQWLGSQSGTMRIEIVRFGNVLGSAGSVIPLFQEQICRGGPVTVTHPEITRYFMSIPEAAQLVLQAAAMGRGGEIFVLDMGEPLKVVDVARNLIRMSGYTTDQIPIVFTGLRPGEKLYEELLADSEVTRETEHPKVRVARSCPMDAATISAILLWIDCAEVPDDRDVRTALRHFLPTYLADCGDKREAPPPLELNAT